MQNNQHKFSFLYTAARLQDVLETLDGVHTAASDKLVDMPNARAQAELVNWLREIAYIASETADEIENASNASQPTFRVVKGGANGDAGRSQDSDPASDERHLTVLAAADTPTPFKVAGR